MRSLAVVVWKWKPAPGADPDRIYTAAHVNKMRSMLARNLHLPHRLHLVTDDPVGDHLGELVDRDVVVHAMPDGPAGFKHARRLRIFDPAFAREFGPRILQLDLDLVILDDITSLVSRGDPFVYSGSNIAVMLFDAGQPRGLWDWYKADPEKRMRQAQAWAHNPRISDQAVVNYWVKGVRTSRDSGRWPAGAVVSSMRQELSEGPPPDAKIVHLYGRSTNPGNPEVQARLPWVREAWR